MHVSRWAFSNIKNLNNLKYGFKRIKMALIKQYIKQEFSKKIIKESGHLTWFFFGNRFKSRIRGIQLVISAGIQRMEMGEQDGLEPYVQTLGVQPVISLSLETNVALPVCSLVLSTGLTVGRVREAYGRGGFCLACSRFSWWLSQ